MRVALKHARELPKFGSHREAERTLTAQRDDALRALEHASARARTFTADYAPASLESLEEWYFELLDDGFRNAPITRALLERAIAMYLGECLVRNEGFAWHVAENPFAEGAYEIGVEREGGSVMLESFGDLAKFRNRKKRQSIRDEYDMYAAFSR